MPGRKRIHATEADRQRAHRTKNADQVNAQRRDGRRLVKLAAQLQQGMEIAAAAGDEIAAACVQAEPVATLSALVDHFQAKAGTPPEERPRQSHP